MVIKSWLSFSCRPLTAVHILTQSPAYPPPCSLMLAHLVLPLPQIFNVAPSLTHLTRFLTFFRSGIFLYTILFIALLSVISFSVSSMFEGCWLSKIPAQGNVRTAQTTNVKLCSKVLTSRLPEYKGGGTPPKSFKKQIIGDKETVTDADEKAVEIPDPPPPPESPLSNCTAAWHVVTLLDNGVIDTSVDAKYFLHHATKVTCTDTVQFLYAWYTV